MPQRQALSGEQTVDAIADAVRAGLDAQLRHDGRVMPPWLFVLAEDLDQPMLCKVACRGFRPGVDAAAALMTMGMAPAVMAATRVVLAWEAQDLNVALQLPVDPDGSALCVLDARLGPRDVLRHYPVRLRHADPGRSRALIPEWGPTNRIHNPAIPRDVPEPVAELLHVWREGWEPASGEVVNRTVTWLETSGYEVRFMARTS
jgi:hypothetical protein